MSATSLVGVVPNIRGRVVSSSDDAQTEDGLYVCGWLKRGPTGIIATNLYDAEETVSELNFSVAILTHSLRSSSIRVMLCL